MRTFDPDIEEILGPVKASTPFGFSPKSPYSAASLFSPGMALWRPRLGSADSDMLGVTGSPKDIMDSRVRDFARNDGVTSGAESYHRDTVVGAHYNLTLRPNYTYLGLGEDWAKEHKEEVEAMWSLAATSGKCYFDSEGRKTFAEMIRLAVGLYVIGGEVLQSVEWIRDSSRPFKTAIQFIEVDRLRDPYATPGSNIRGGVERDPNTGKPIAYYILRAHPADFIYNPTLNPYIPDRIPAAKPWGRKQIIHTFEQSRVDQTRGLALITASLPALRARSKLQEVTLEQAILGATYAASIESELPSDQVFAQMGAGGANAFERYATDWMGALAKYTGGRALQIDGVKVPHFFPGTKLNVRNVGTPGGIGTGFEASLHRHAARNLGMSYEEYSGDFSNANYSTLKAGVALTRRRMNGVKKVCADRVANDIFALWYEEQFNNNRFSTLPRRAPSIYEGLNFEAYTRAEWIGSGWGQIDELKETQAAFLRIQYGLSTRQAEIARTGGNYEEVMQQLQREQELAESLGLTFGGAPAENALTAATSTPNEQTGNNGQL